MTTSDAGVSRIKQFEGCRLRAYRCPAGRWTIGYGHTQGVTERMTISPSQAERFLTDDLEQTEDVINRCVWVTLTQLQFDALVSLVFNIGEEAFATSTLLTKLNAGDVAGAANEFNRWVYADGKKLTGLVRRRAAERERFLS
ncbi:MAG: lysozyme [Candidatus Arsenophonus phytopathogenicus]